jgi:hypothetical protein
MESIVDRIRILKKVMEGASKMKVLIWLVLIVLCSAAQVLVRYLGISHWIIPVTGTKAEPFVYQRVRLFP